ncbi:acyltransferase [Polaribacter sp. WD7]|uniref:acyltransferase n=1 Tax=Polaribacter sp. WD7 TaxID=2269061 RepID=UPI000DF15112|nr:acyltransferase [Polaribacter sp. WD7]RCS27702.1 acyltransferase [Polaribacter sp. WD7]
MIKKLFKYIYMNINIIKKMKLLDKKYKFSELTKRFKSNGEFNDVNLSLNVVYPERLELGSYIYIGPNAFINALGGVKIKTGTIIGPNLTIHSANHKYKNAKYIPYDETFEFRKVVIGENVWIGGNVIIAPGSEIGEGCIVGAGTVVSGKIPKMSIVVGNPCRVIKKRDEKHYFNLKKENMIYLKKKKENNLKPKTAIY